MSTLNEKTKFNLTLGALLALIMTIFSATAFWVNKVNEFKNEVRGSVMKLQQSVDAMAGQQWRIDDQIEYTHDLERFNQELKLRVPDARTIIRQRFQSPGAESERIRRNQN